MSKIIGQLLKSEEEMTSFATFIKIAGNEAVFIKLNTGNGKPMKIIKKIMRKIVQRCTEDQTYYGFIERFLETDMLRSSANQIEDIIEKKHQSVASVYTNEKTA